MQRADRRITTQKLAPRKALRVVSPATHGVPVQQISFATTAEELHPR